MTTNEAAELLRAELYEDWWLERCPEVEKLREALHGGVQEALLKRWIKESAKTLRLAKLTG